MKGLKQNVPLTQEIYFMVKNIILIDCLTNVALTTLECFVETMETRESFYQFQIIIHVSRAGRRVPDHPKDIYF